MTGVGIFPERVAELTDFPMLQTLSAVAPSEAILISNPSVALMWRQG